MDAFVSAVFALFKDSTIPLIFILGGAVLLIWKRRAQPSGLAVALMLAPILLLALSSRWAWLLWPAWIATPLLMLLLLADGFLLSVHPQQLHLSRMLLPKLSVGRPSQVEIQMINNASSPVRLEVMDSVPSALLKVNMFEQVQKTAVLSAFSQQTLTYDVYPTRRGVYSFGKIHMRYRSRLGLLWMTLQAGRPETVKVTPDLMRVRHMQVQASRAMAPGELKKRTLGIEGTQFSGLRHYFAGDDVKKMAWQSTAKLDIPVIRTFEHEVEQPILLLLDAGRKMSSWTDGLCKYDWALNAALSLMAVAVDRNDDVGAFVFSNQLIAQVPFGSGTAHWRTLLEKLSETEVQLVEPDYAGTLFQIARGLKRRTLVVLFTDLIDPASSNQLMQGLKAFSKKHVLLIATLSDRNVLEQAKDIPDNAYDAYRRGVSLDLLELRRQALAVLSAHHSATVIDAPPGKLDEALIQRYLKIRQRTLI